MNLKFLSTTFIFALLIYINVSAQSPKRELRATWLATVWAIDFPKNTGATAQKAELIRMLDSIQNNRFNAIFFQVRSRCDAFYNSAYEPWSTDLKVNRGVNPGWDPLAFAIEECHKRSIECHAWLNPYRYATTAEGWTGSNAHPQNYQESNPDWLMYYPAKNYWILNPGIPEVRKRIKNVVGDILSKYDVDGIIFDDYFYSYGGTSDQDKTTVTKYRPSGMETGDWRRDNVNRMIADVYDTIQAVKPWVTFGVSPFGIWTTDASVAAKEGIVLPSGITGGNMYAEIYCDPVAWLKQGTVDYVSPQLYWKSGGSQDYTKLCPWWSDLANRFGRHFYSSMSTSNFAENFPEVSLQIVYNRASSKNFAPGSVFYNTTSWWNYTAFKNQLRQNLYTHFALPPAINWKEYSELPSPAEIRIEGDSLKWQKVTGDVRYSIYAIPNEELLKTGNFATSKYLIGISWKNSFSISKFSTLVATHKFGVAVLDRYGNEFAPSLMGFAPAANKAPNLIIPYNNGAVFPNLFFKWENVQGAEYYVIEFSQMSDFSKVFYRTDTDKNTFDISNLYLETGKTYYWRVRTRKIGVADAISETRSFSLLTIGITSPTQSQTGLSISPQFTWTAISGIDSYTLQISETSNFAKSIHEATGLTANSYNPGFGVLQSNKTYYVRVKAVLGDASSFWSNSVMFTTENVLPAIPVVLSPVPDSRNDINSGLFIKVLPDYYATSITFQFNLSNGFSVFTNVQKTLDYGQYEGIVEGLKADTLYYVRVRANHASGSTAWTNVFTIRTKLDTHITEFTNNETAIFSPTLITAAVHYLKFDLEKQQRVRLYLTDINGRRLKEIASGEFGSGSYSYTFTSDELSRGIYLLVFETSNGKKVIKLIK